MKRKLLVAVLCALAVFGCATFAAYAVGAPGNEGNAAGGGAPKSVYVRSDGNDVTGDGSQEKPYASLAKAVEAADDGATVYVLDDITSTKCARFYGKSLTIYGGGHSVNRGTQFEVQQDNERSTYNPGLFEIGSTESTEGSYSLTLINIVLDDNRLHSGDKFDIQQNGVDSNCNLVQDSIVASYSDKCTVILGDKAVLKNYGGMSAVNVSGGARLIMESGSAITDSPESEGHSPRTNGAAAIHAEGGIVEMREGSAVKDLQGRGIMIEYSGEAIVNGSLSNIKAGGSAMRKGYDGVAIYLAQSSACTLGPTGRIERVSADKEPANGTAAVTAFGSRFTTQSGSVISNVEDIKVFYLDDYGNEFVNKAVFDGTVTDCHNKDSVIMTSWYGHIVIGKAGLITKCTADTRIGILYSNNGTKYSFYGSIKDNGSNALYLANQSGMRPEGFMYDGAEISGNRGNGLYLNNGCAFTMYGGKISGNASSGVYMREKNETFTMSGGEIGNNGGYGIVVNATMFFIKTGTPTATITGGKLFGNKSGDVRISDTEGMAKDSVGHLSFIRDAVAEGAVSTPFGNLTISEGGPSTIAVGTANKSAGTAILDKLKEIGKEEWKKKGSYCLWFKTDDKGIMHFTMPRPSSQHVLWAGYIPLGADGLPKKSADLKLVELGGSNKETIEVDLNGLDANGAYALMLIESQTKIIRPLDLKKYITRDHVHGDDDLSNCFPDPRYENLSEDNTIKVAGKEWIPEDHNGAPYPFTINYYELEKDGSEVLIKDDHAPGTYIARVEVLSGLGIRPEDITINDEHIVFEPGELQILEVTNATDIEDIEGETTVVSDSAPNNSVTQAVAVVDDGVQWLVNGISKQYPNEGADIRLLQDEVLSNEQDEDAYVQMMIKRVEREMSDKGLELDGPRQYAMKYLDFFDAHDSNVIVEPKLEHGKTYDLYIPYPSGTGQDTKFYLFDFLDLDRTYTAEDYGENAQTVIEECELVTYMESSTKAASKNGKLEAAPIGIKVTMEQGSRLGAMALVWSQAEHTITASAGEGGAISPSGAVKVRDTGSKTFTVTVNEGYSLQDVLVDGKSVALDDRGQYTFQDVKEDHTITASFKSNGGTGPVVTYHTIEASAGNGGAISPNGRVSVVHGANKTFSFTADKGYAIDTVTVDGESVGVALSYTFESVTSNHSINVSFRKDDQPANPDDTGVSDLLQTTEHDLFLYGYPDGTFAPDQNMTRAEAAAMFYNLLKDKDVAITKSFSDIPAGAWYERPVGVLATLGMIKGYEGTDLYGPENPITRAEFTAIAMRFTKKAARAANFFSDVYESDWYYGPVVGSIAYGWIHGYDDGTFRPNASITRAEVTAITNSMLGRRADKVYIDAASKQEKLKLFEDVKSDHWAYYDIVEATNPHGHTVSDGVESWTGLKSAQ